MAITIGASATDRAWTFSCAWRTTLVAGWAANATGTISTFEVFMNTATSATAVKIGTVYGSSTSYTSRDFESLGDVTTWSKQTFSGLNCSVQTGDFVAIYCTAGFIELDSTGDPIYYYTGDAFDWGTKTYNDVWVSRTISLYGTGTEAPTTSIKSFNGLAYASVKSVNWLAIASVKSWNGLS